MRRPWERLDTRVAQAFLVAALLSPLFAPVYRVLFAGQIEPRLAALRLEAVVSQSLRAHQLDPWGREFVTGMDLCYSVGPNGVDENGGGDDVWVMERSIYRVVERPAVAIYLGAPWNVLTLLALLWGTFALARLLPRGRASLEALATLLAATPLLVLVTWLVDSYGWFVGGMLTDVLLIPAWLAAWLTCVLLTLLGVTGVRRLRP